MRKSLPAVIQMHKEKSKAHSEGMYMSHTGADCQREVRELVSGIWTILDQLLRRPLADKIDLSSCGILWHQYSDPSLKVIIACGLYEHMGKWHYLLVTGGLAAPLALQPLFFPSLTGAPLRKELTLCSGESDTYACMNR